MSDRWESIHINPLGFFRYRVNEGDFLFVRNACGDPVYDTKIHDAIRKIIAVSDKIKMRKVNDG